MVWLYFQCYQKFHSDLLTTCRRGCNNTLTSIVVYDLYCREDVIQLIEDYICYRSVKSKVIQMSTRQVKSTVMQKFPAFTIKAASLPKDSSDLLTTSYWPFSFFDPDIRPIDKFVLDDTSITVRCDEKFYGMNVSHTSKMEFQDKYPRYAAVAAQLVYHRLSCLAQMDKKPNSNIVYYGCKPTMSGYITIWNDAGLSDVGFQTEDCKPDIVEPKVESTLTDLLPRHCPYCGKKLILSTGDSFICIDGHNSRITLNETLTTITN